VKICESAPMIMERSCGSQESDRIAKWARPLTKGCRVDLHDEVA